METKRTRKNITTANAFQIDAAPLSKKQRDILVLRLTRPAYQHNLSFNAAVEKCFQPLSRDLLFTTHQPSMTTSARVSVADPATIFPKDSADSDISGFWPVSRLPALILLDNGAPFYGKKFEDVLQDPECKPNLDCCRTLNSLMMTATYLLLRFIRTMRSRTALERCIRSLIQRGQNV